MKPRKLIKFLRCDLSADEHKQAALELARANEAMAQIEEEKKVATSQFGERIAQAKATIGKYSRVISNGYEMRQIECRVLYHMGAKDSTTGGLKLIHAVPQVKTILRLDTFGLRDFNFGNIDQISVAPGAIVAVEAMSESELQESFDFDQQQQNEAVTPVPGLPSADDLDAAATEEALRASRQNIVCSVCGGPATTCETPCDNCQADAKVDKSARASMKRASKVKVVSAKGHEAGSEEF